jgi:hypothetical protein
MRQEFAGSLFNAYSQLAQSIKFRASNKDSGVAVSVHHSGLPAADETEPPASAALRTQQLPQRIC